MKKTILISCLLGISAAHAQTAPAPLPSTAKPLPAQRPATAIPQAATVQPAPQPAPVPLTPEQRHQQELLANAQRIDQANRELLAKNQELQLQNESLAMQVNVIKRDKSSEGIWKGALAVIAGFLMGWFFASSGNRRKSSW